MNGVKPAVGSALTLPPDADLLIQDVQEVPGGHEYLCEWWVLGTQFRCWIPEAELTAEGSGEGPAGVGRA